MSTGSPVTTVLYRLSLIALLLAAMSWLVAIERETFALLLLVREIAHPVPSTPSTPSRPF